jgi:ubiquinone/menaquinone biosynthesis C-methylase UbiE
MGTEKTGAVEAFQAWAVTYDQTVSKELERYAGITHQGMLDRLLQLAQLKNGDLVLDVGTGTGWLAIRCALEVEEGQIIGVDITPEMLAQAALNAEKVGVRERVHFAPASAMSLPYPDDEFDVVLSSLALHHTTVSQSLAEMVRVLKPGGRLAIADMAAPPAWRSAPISWLMLLLAWAYKLTGSPKAKAEAAAFQQTYTAEEWRSLLAAKGLREVQVTAIIRPGQRIYPCVILTSGVSGANGPQE